MRVQLVWTPYERVAYVLWHVALRCVIAGDGSGTAAATGRAAAPHSGMRNSRGQGSALPPRAEVRRGTACEVWCELPAATDTSPPHRAHLDPSSVVLIPPAPAHIDLGNSGLRADGSVGLRAGRIYPPRGDGRRSC